MQQLKTTSEIYKDEYMPLCKCNRGTKAINICFIPDCPGYAQA